MAIAFQRGAMGQQDVSAELTPNEGLVKMDRANTTHDFKVGDMVALGKVSANGQYKISQIEGKVAWLEGTDCYWDTSLLRLATPAPKPRPQADEYWMARNGEVFGPLKMDERTGMFFVGESILLSLGIWFPTGVSNIANVMSRDLITRVDVCAHCGKPLERK